jgi:glycosyltransferase involved in cell wall biosynthesis
MIWFDVTDILAWGRPPVGIIRTQVEIGNRLLQAYGAEIQFCTYQSDRFVPVGRERYRAAIAELALPPTSPNARARSAVEQLRAFYGFLLGHGPRFVAVPLRTAVSLLKSVAMACSRRRYPADEHFASSGDVYLSFGRDWETPGKVADLDVLRRRGIHPILCCYDLIPLQFPHYYGADVRDRFQRYLDGALSAASTILCISDCTKQDVAAYAAQQSARPPRLATVILGTDHLPVEADIAAPILRPFILYVSTIERRKNHETLYQAYVTIREKKLGEPPLCVLVGMETPRAHSVLVDMRQDPRVHGDFLILDRASDATLRWLYERCLFTVFPSLYEGWGLPVAESLRQGKLVLASKASSLPEVGGTGAEYFDPWDVDAWARAIMFFASDHEALRERESRIRRDFAPPLWQECLEVVRSEIARLSGRVDGDASGQAASETCGKKW